MRDFCTNDTDARLVGFLGVSKCWNDGLCGWIYWWIYCYCGPSFNQKNLSVFFLRCWFAAKWPVDHLSVEKNIARSIMRFHDIWVCLIGTPQIHWLLMIFPECSPLKCLEIGNWWNSVPCSDTPKYQSLDEIPWNPMKSHEIPWNPMKHG